MSDTTHMDPGLSGSDLRFIADRLTAGVIRLREALDRLFQDHPDAEAAAGNADVMGRLVGALDACGEVIDRRKRVRKVRKGLQRLRRNLGAAREAIVGLATIRSLASEVSADEEILAGFLAASFSSELQSAELRVKESPDRAAGDRLFRDVRGLITRLTDLAMKSKPPAAEAPTRTLEDRAMDLMRAGRTALLDLPREPLRLGDDGALHRFRIAGKKLRYTMEFYQPLFSPRLANRIRLLRQIQDCLGDAHDLADLERRILGMSAGMNASGFDAGLAACRSLKDRVEARRRKTLRALSGFLKALDHPGFLPAPVSQTAPEHAGPKGTAAPRLRIVDAAGDDQRKVEPE